MLSKVAPLSGPEHKGLARFRARPPSMTHRVGSCCDKRTGDHIAELGNTPAAAVPRCNPSVSGDAELRTEDAHGRLRDGPSCRRSGARGGLAAAVHRHKKKKVRRVLADGPSFQSRSRAGFMWLGCGDKHAGGCATVGHRATLGEEIMEWFSRKTSIAGTEIPNWILVVVAIVVILVLYRLIA